MTNKMPVTGYSLYVQEMRSHDMPLPMRFIGELWMRKSDGDKANYHRQAKDQNEALGCQHVGVITRSVQRQLDTPPQPPTKWRCGTEDDGDYCKKCNADAIDDELVPNHARGLCYWKCPVCPGERWVYDRVARKRVMATKSVV